jgi:excisionase family DNA binding protein
MRTGLASSALGSRPVILGHTTRNDGDLIGIAIVLVWPFFMCFTGRPMSDYLTISQLAARLGVSRWTLYSWVGSGVLPHFRLGRQLRFDASEVDEALRARRSIPPGRRHEAKATNETPVPPGHPE